MTPADRFASLADLQARHVELVRAVGREVLAGDTPARIAAFVKQAVATGRCSTRKKTGPPPRG